MIHYMPATAFLLAFAIHAPAFAADAADKAKPVKYDDAGFCSNWLAKHDDSSLTPADHRRCIIAIAGTYIDAEENSLPPEKQLLADDVARHRLGNPVIHEPGNAAKIIATHEHDVIAKIANREWTVDGNRASVRYDGYLKAKPDKPDFFVSEQFTIEKGLIKEIMVAGVAHAS